ncbi:MAG: type II toxin-antitoxin system HicA family toxin [Ignavibacteria bacterium]|nr:type II toxin-antitoxin system HicA family toxin [Ignavibacteria bacterium]HRJ85633.1 type II toxin-antitoxin system HicA family toxin [Ignavibacteria bacterium]
MGKIPVLKPSELIRVLNKLGFVEVRQRGSHIQFRHSDGRGTTVPNHKGRDVSPILLKQILKDIKIEIVEFTKHL